MFQWEASKEHCEASKCSASRLLDSKIQGISICNDDMGLLITHSGQTIDAGLLTFLWVVLFSEEMIVPSLICPKLLILAYAGLFNQSATLEVVCMYVRIYTYIYNTHT